MALGSERKYIRASCLHLNDIAHRLIKQRSISAESNNESAVFDKRYRAVLELARCVCLGMDVGYFLELERTLKPHRVVKIAADEENRAVVKVV